MRSIAGTGLRRMSYEAALRDAPGAHVCGAADSRATMPEHFDACYDTRRARVIGNAGGKVRAPGHGGHDSGLMADRIPRPWRTVFRRDGGQFGSTSGTVSAMTPDRGRS